MNAERLKNTLTFIYNKESRQNSDALIIVSELEDEGIFGLICGRTLDDAANALALLQRRTKDSELKAVAEKLQQQLTNNTFLRP